ncbi:MAG: DUF1285 domain-containing protein [Clostridia bacterium]|nr:MAG: DUF1285 domain-containing protein [Clostridia bacterium]
MTSMTEMRIKADGKWYWGDNEIFRPEILRLFASHLVRRESGYFIEMNGQTYPVTVDDAPFVADAVWPEGAELQMRLVDTRVLPFPPGEIMLRDGKPYTSLDQPGDIRLSRAAFWQLAPYLQENDGSYEFTYGDKHWSVQEAR